MAAQVQRKLEFPVKKLTRSRQEKCDTDSPARSTRRSTRTSKKNQENIDDSAKHSKNNQDDIDNSAKNLKKNLENMEYRVKPEIQSPRKKSSDDEDFLVRPPFATPSPVKKRKDEHFSPIRRDETPCRSSLAAKLAATKVSDDVKDWTNRQLQLSPYKSSPVKSSPLKGKLALKRLVDSPVKSPLKSPVKPKQKTGDVNSPRKQLSLASSPQKKLKFESLGQSTKEIAGRSPSKKSSPSKTTNLKGSCAAYNQAKQSFHTAKPERIIGRDKETEEIRHFMRPHMVKRTGGSLYISGAPGTGKTAVLTHIIDELKGTHSCKSVYLNCMTLENPSSVYGKLYTDITGKNAPTAKERLRAVEKVLSSEGPSIVLVLDEIDQLDSKNQEILYTIFEWPSLKKSRLILIGIANALDLTDRILPRLQARPKCRPQLLNFSPYTKDQISAILKDRIRDMEKDGSSIVDPIAIQFCARKISAVAGDMRKALDVCRRAVELVETDVKSPRILKSRDSVNNSPVKQPPGITKKIGVSHINNVLSEVYGSGAAAQQQETIPLQQKLVVCTLLLMLKQGKAKEVTTGKLHEVYCKICKKRQMSPVDQSEFQGIVTLLESRGMLGVKKGKESRLSKVWLKLDEKELEHTMQDKVLISSIIQDGLPN